MWMYYKEFGIEHSTLMVFIHGGGVSGWMWDKQVEYFRSKFHCLVPDLPEHGKSIHEGHFTIDGAADKIINLINEKSNGKRVIAIGFSLGAQVLIAMIGKKPQLIDFAMINSPLVKKIPFANALTNSMMFAFPLVKYKAFSKIQAKSMYITEDYYDIYYEESCQLTKDSFLRVMKENMSFTIPHKFNTSNSKILVTVGEKERKIMKDSMKEVTNNSSNSKGVILPNIGHGFSLAHPDLFNRVLEEWIENDVNTL
ncbi:alpha/beta hydrolase [Sutcliffiella cohnii]|uniref:Alpha/beta hydrolase n=1 Tax=Sutcliffiella cohnii TaxID=33932 RepID=A0A223KY61_9BACI|nr:alpha/beta hydrolase [Sutcliffiella cohnii]AST94369.1 alpha/beta hydrolase [Sutcliffiella cohnii]